MYRSWYYEGRHGKQRSTNLNSSLTLYQWVEWALFALLCRPEVTCFSPFSQYIWTNEGRNPHFSDCIGVAFRQESKKISRTNCKEEITLFPAIRCSEPEDIENGDVDRKCQTFGCRISYSCRAGYELVGRQHRYCQADGTWSPRILPECVRKYNHNLKCVKLLILCLFFLQLFNVRSRAIRWTVAPSTPPWATTPSFPTSATTATCSSGTAWGDVRETNSGQDQSHIAKVRKNAYCLFVINVCVPPIFFVKVWIIIRLKTHFLLSLAWWMQGKQWKVQ